MNQFRPSCEAAAAAGGCLFPRCISSACAEFAGVRRTSHSTNHTTPATARPVYYLLGTASLCTFCPRLRLPVENFAPMEWPSGPAKLAAGTLDWVVKAGYYSSKAADSIRSLATGHWTTDWGVELSRNFCKVSHCPEKAPHYVFPLAENAYYIFNN